MIKYFSAGEEYPFGTTLAVIGTFKDETDHSLRGDIFLFANRIHDRSCSYRHLRFHISTEAENLENALGHPMDSIKCYAENHLLDMKDIYLKDCKREMGSHHFLSPEGYEAALVANWHLWFC